jgi:hypothetical protein
MDANFLRKIGEDVYIIQADDEPLAVLMGYDAYLIAQQLTVEAVRND